MVNEARAVFLEVESMSPNTIEGRCARLMNTLDSPLFSISDMDRLHNLADTNREDMFIRWMLAIQCRTHNLDEQGAHAYEIILNAWNPGPVLVSQTFANLLSNLGQYERALIYRQRAVELEPAGWSYQGLGATLTYLNQPEKADAAFKRSVELSDESTYWLTWAWSLKYRQLYPEAINKCKKALDRDPQNWLAISIWADSLNALGQRNEALEKYRECISLNPSYEYAYKQISTLREGR